MPTGLCPDFIGSFKALAGVSDLSTNHCPQVLLGPGPQPFTDCSALSDPFSALPLPYTVTFLFSRHFCSSQGSLWQRLTWNNQLCVQSRQEHSQPPHNLWLCQSAGAESVAAVGSAGRTPRDGQSLSPPSPCLDSASATPEATLCIYQGGTAFPVCNMFCPFGSSPCSSTALPSRFPLLQMLCPSQGL